MLTIIIPTMNRSEYLIRLLNYYAGAGCEHWISIGDSSDKFQVERTRKAIQKIGSKLKINYHEYPGLSDSECYIKLSAAVTTPYAVYTADDDILLPRALNQCVDFLNDHPDYSAVHGRGIMFALDGAGAHGRMVSIYEYPQPVLEQDTAAERIKDHLSNYKVSLFSVHRTGIWKNMFGKYDMSDRTFAAELLPCCLSAIEGKVAEIDSLYLVRQAHAGRYLLPLPSEWIKTESWKTSFDIFERTMAEYLAKQDGISIDDALQVVISSFDVYLNDCLAREKQNRLDQSAYLNKIKSSLKQKIKARLFERYRLLPIWHGIKRIKYLVIALRDGKKDSMLKTLLSTKSPYHKDFMPVYRAIVELPKEVN